MRQAGSFREEKLARKFLLFLRSKRIECKLDADKSGAFDIWVYNEDDLDKAKELFSHFQENPEDESYASFDTKLKEDKSLPSSDEEKGGNQPKSPIEDAAKRVRQSRKIPPQPKALYYPAVWTKLLILACLIIFVVSMYQKARIIEAKGGETPILPIITSIEAPMLYDYPKALSMTQQFNAEYDLFSEEGLDKLPKPGKELLNQIEKTPFWPGLYQIFLNWSNRARYLSAPLFGDILKGEVWRLITPIFLHAGLLHIVFNMLWLWLLGKMIEINMGKVRMTIFILISAALTNTFQYIAAGPLFMGFSGVISAMAGYIFIRKRIAPWEIYLIDNSTLIFLWIFIFGLLGLQMIAFFLQIFHIVSFQMRIANTAHVSGLILGCLLARFKIFARKV